MCSAFQARQAGRCDSLFGPVIAHKSLVAPLESPGPLHSPGGRYLYPDHDPHCARPLVVPRAGGSALAA